MFQSSLSQQMPQVSPLYLTFANGHSAPSIRITPTTDLGNSLQSIGLEFPCPVLVVVGGASGMDEWGLQSIEAIFTNVIAPLAQQFNLMVIDGGTDSGVMKLMGKARQQVQGTFPLLGVAAFGTIALPDDPDPPEESAPLEPHHSHFILVPGFLWGDEAPWIARLATFLSAGTASMTLLINGGKIAWMDVTESVKAQRSVVVVKGSGRTADCLAAAIEGDSSNERANKLVASGLLHLIDLHQGYDDLAQRITAIFGRS